MRLVMHWRYHGVRTVYGLCTDHVRMAYGSCTDGVRIVYAWCTDLVRILYLWCTHGVRLEEIQCCSIEHPDPSQRGTAAIKQTESWQDKIMQSAERPWSFPMILSCHDSVAVPSRAAANILSTKEEVCRDELKEYDLVIIGGGPAGIVGVAAVALRHLRHPGSQHGRSD